MVDNFLVGGCWFIFYKFFMFVVRSGPKKKIHNYQLFFGYSYNVEPIQQRCLLCQ